MWILRCAATATVLLLGGAAFGQAVQPPAPALQAGDVAARQPTGTVTGRVICSDTQRPARFAQVQLQSVQSASQPATGIGSGGGFFGGGGSGGRTGADGTFTLSGVAPGDYYVTASAPGYIPERLLLESQAAAGANAADLLARLPQVHVAPDGSSSATVNMERGAVISGRVAWEDGSPASGVQMTAVLNAPAAATQPVIRFGGARSFGGTATDDRGMFRLLGLPTGEYILQATVQADFPGGGFRGGRSFSPPRIIQVFAPGVFHRADAKLVVVRAGEERNDVRLTIDLGSLRTVAGHVGSTAGGGVASGRISLVDTTDATVNLRANVEPDGTFRVTYVPPGSYTLGISGASSQAGFGGGGRRGGGAQPSAGTSFSPFTQPVLVRDADLTDLDYNLSPVAPAAAQ